MTRPARMQPLPTTTFAVLEHFVLAERGSEGGCICPVCHAQNKVKKYRFIEAHFDIMRTLRTYPPGEPVHCRTFVSDGQAYNKMLNVPKHYGLLGQAGGNDENPFDRSGEWFLTERGRDFINGLCRLPYYFWGIQDRAIWWALAMGTADEIEARTVRAHPRTLIEEIMRASLNNEGLAGGPFNIEYLDGRDNPEEE